MRNTKIGKSGSQAIEHVGKERRIRTNLLGLLNRFLTAKVDEHFQVRGHPLTVRGERLILESTCIRVSSRHMCIQGRDLVLHMLNQLSQMDETISCEVKVARLPRRHDVLGMLQRRFPFFTVFALNVASNLTGLVRKAKLHCFNIRSLSRTK